MMAPLRFRQSLDSALNSIVIEEARTKISYFFKVYVKENKQEKQSSFLFKPVLILSTFREIKKKAAELCNITSLLPSLSLLLLLFSSVLVPFVFSNIHLKKKKKVS